MWKALQLQFFDAISDIFTGGQESLRSTFYEERRLLQRRDMATLWWPMTDTCMCLGVPQDRLYQMNCIGKPQILDPRGIHKQFLTTALLQP